MTTNEQIPGNPFEASLGVLADVETHLDRAEALAGQHGGAQALATVALGRAVAALIPFVGRIAHTLELHQERGQDLAQLAADLTQLAQPAPAPDPANPDFTHDVEALAEDLWATDGTRRTGARSFGEEYAATQDRYLEQARRLLDPTERGAA